MSKNHNFTLHRIFSVILCISIIVTGICLICGCLTIYFTGDHSYSREIVAATFKDIAIPVYVCVVFTLVSVVWELISPSNQSKRVSFKDYPDIINKLSQKKEFNDNDTVGLITREKRNRRIHIIIRTVIILITSIAFLAYALNGDNFHQSEINGSMIRAMFVLIPCLLVSFGYGIFTSYYCMKSYERELDLIKKLPASETSNISVNDNSFSSKNLIFIRIAIAVLAIALILFGYMAGGTTDVLTKAINICTECIGLG
ncbi:MAG: hypothetical protein IKL36_07510 [Clostridia bacterium]|nr:hypothetical protein [Clostridia bacterium]